MVPSSVAVEITFSSISGRYRRFSTWNRQIMTVPFPEYAWVALKLFVKPNDNGVVDTGPVLFNAVIRKISFT
jgi:hypothetical protein